MHLPRQAINARSAATVGPYSHAVGAGDLVFLSGQTPTDPSTGLLVTGSVVHQTDQCLRNLFSQVDPRLIFVSIFGLTMVLLASAPLRDRLLKAGDLEEDLIARHVIALMTAGLTGESQSTKR